MELWSRHHGAGTSSQYHGGSAMEAVPWSYGASIMELVPWRHHHAAPLSSVSGITVFTARFVLEEERGDISSEGTTTAFPPVRFHVKFMRFICIEN